MEIDVDELYNNQYAYFTKAITKISGSPLLKLEEGKLMALIKGLIPVALCGGMAYDDTGLLLEHSFEEGGFKLYLEL